MDVITAARALIGDTLAFHLLFITFGVSLPLIISGLELYGIITKKPRVRALARTWSKALVILFIAGAVSGTIVSFQFSLLWPKFMEFASKVVGLSFALEGFAFLIEALFLSIYMLSWDRFKPWAHWLCSIPIVIGSLTSAFFITTVNAWMNHPQGFRLDENGQPIDINVVKAIFNPAVATETSHSIFGYMFATLSVLIAIYAWRLWRRHDEPKVQFRLKRLISGLAILALIFGLLVGFTGDRSGKYLAEHQPAKLAAAEGLYETRERAPLIIGGLLQDGQFKYGLEVPGALSYLATNDINGTVTGLNDIPVEERPSMMIHYFFDTMVAIGIATVGVLIVFLAFRRFRPKWAFRPSMLIILVISGFLGMIALEAGWMLTEFGRQPYVIRGVLKTKDVATTSEAAIRLGFVFPVLYIILFGLTIWALRRTVNYKESLE